MVRHHFDQLLQPTAVPAQARLASLEQEAKLSQLRLVSIDNCKRNRQLNAERRKLAAMSS